MHRPSAAQLARVCLVEGAQKTARKHGPKSKLEKRLETVADMLLAQQQGILNVVQALTAHAQSACCGV